MFRQVWQTIRGLMSRQMLEQELDAELQDHLARDIEFRQRQGATPEEARRAAYAALGGVGATRDDLREVHGLTTLDDLKRDAALALRRLRRNPGFASLVVGTMALGAGAATTVFSAVDGVLLKPLPFRDHAQLVTLWQTKPSAGIDRDDVSPANWLDWSTRLKSYAGLAAGNPYSVNHRTRESTANIESWQVSEGFFRLLDVAPVLGRSLRADDFAIGSQRVVVLDHDFWQSRLGGDPGVVGTPLTLDDRPYTVVGIMPRHFALPARTAMWQPFVPDSAQQADRFGTYLKVFGRLRDGVSIETATAELATVTSQLEREFPRANTGVGASVVVLRDVIIGGRAPLLWTLMGASLLLLLVTVANVSALHLTRLARQQQETAVRVALGGRGMRLLRPLVLEALWLALLSGGLGAAVGWAGVRLLHRLGPADLPRLDEIALDGRAVFVSMTLALVTGLVLASVSMRRVRGLSGQAALSSRSATGHRGSLRVRRAAVGTQLALALILLVGTALLVRSFRAVLSADRGYRSDHLLSFTTWVYSEYPTPDDRVRYVSMVTERLQALPGVTAVSMGSALPLADQITGESADVVMEGASVVEGEEPQARGMVTWPGYFSTLGMSVRRGRTLDATDDERAEPVVVVNEAFARRFSPDRDVVGRMVRVGLMGRARPRRIVGVVADTRHTRLDAAPDAAVYIPWRQQPLASITFVVRTTGDPGAMAPVVQRVMFELDPRVGIARVATLDQLVGQHVRERQFLLLLLGGFAGVAVLLACVGVSGVMAQSVLERQREIGVRMALGATPARIRQTLFRDAMVLAAWGLGAGTIAALVGTRLISSFLYAVSPHDVAGFTLAVGVLGLFAGLAAVGPSLRATRTDPARVLQDG